MHYSSNFEPRRMWKRRLDKLVRLDDVDWELDGKISSLPGGDPCLSCGARVAAAQSDAGSFCAECIERSRASLLDPLYDDLGVGD